jgi:predicted esterase
LLLALHGAGIGASGPIDFLGPYAEENKFLLLSPAARSNTWDAILGQYGPDVAFIDAALNLVFSRAAVDPARIFVEGFSDGASYALGLGLANGDLFSKVVSFSPGFVPRSDTVAHGHPGFFVSHGRQDPILPIDVSSRRIVPALRDQGYTVEYVEYDGEHSVPPAIAQQALAWLLG